MRMHIMHPLIPPHVFSKRVSIIVVSIILLLNSAAKSTGAAWNKGLFFKEHQMQLCLGVKPTTLRLQIKCSGYFKPDVLTTETYAFTFMQSHTYTHTQARTQISTLT